jgi:hypothetical protein
MIQEESKAILRGETDVFQTWSRAEIRNYRRMYLGSVQERRGEYICQI